MSDIEIFRKKVEVSTLKNGIMRNEFKIMELEEDKKRILESIDAQKKRIDELELELKGE